LSGTRFMGFIVGFAIIVMGLYVGFHTYFDLIIYAYLCIGIGILIGAIVYDSDMFRELDEDLRKRIAASWFVAFLLGGTFGYLIHGIPGGGFGAIIGWLSIEIIDAFYILFFVEVQETQTN